MGVATQFFGREQERAQLIAMSLAHELITVVGPGGVGKTRLAMEVFDELVDHFEGRPLFAQLAAVDAGADANTVASALGFESAAAASMALAEQPTLVVLDNCEHVTSGVRAFLDTLFAAPETSTVVATSREPLGVAGERVLVLSPLPVPAAGWAESVESPAVALFLDRARNAGAQLGAEPGLLHTVAELCRDLDGLPLAIELAAARSRALSPTELLQLMDERLDVLRRARAVTDRHDSMRAALEVSIGALSDDEQQVFARLSVFSGSFDLPLARAVAGDLVDAQGMVDTITRLVDCSLVVADASTASTAYRLLHLVRSYAAELLAEAGQAEIAREHFVAAMVDAADRFVAAALGQWSTDVLAAASAQFANFVRACEFALGIDKDASRAVRLMLPMFVAVHEGHATDVVDIGTRLFARWPDGEVPWRAEATAVLATAHVLAGVTDSLVPLAASVSADPGATDVALALVERALGLAARSQGGHAAREHFDRAAAAAARVGMASVRRECEVYAATEADLLGAGDEALRSLDSLLDECRGENDRFVEVLARMARARVLLRAGRGAAATTEIEAADAVAVAGSVRWWRAAMLRTRAAVAAAAEGWPAAAAYSRMAVDHAAAVGAIGELALSMRNAAVLAERTGHHDEADVLMRVAPNSAAITVLAEIYPHDLRRVESRSPGTVPPATTEALRIVRELLDRAASAAASPGGKQQAAAPRSENAWLFEGDTWLLRYRDVETRLRHLKGFTDLAVLLARPGVEVHCLELMGGHSIGGDTGPMIDAVAKQTYQRRIIELQAEIDSARDANDNARAELAELELDALVEQLSTAFGLSGRPRTTGSAAERARTAVTYRVRAAVRKISAVRPDLGRHLEHSVRTGTWCCYEPEEAMAWRVKRASR